MLIVTQMLVITSGAFIAGTLSGVAGGSGIVVLPLLLMAGVPPQLALGTNKLFTTATLFSSCQQFFKQNMFIWKHWIVAIISTLFGAVAGVILAIIMPEKWLRNILPVFIAGVAIYSIIPKRKKTQKIDISYHIHKRWLKTAMASLLGIYSGFFGAGTSLMWNTFITKVLHIEAMEASAITRIMCFLANITALIVFMILHKIDYSVGITLSIMGMLGALLGSRITLKLGPKIIKPSLFITTMAMAAELGYSAWF